jgi:transposase
MGSRVELFAAIRFDWQRNGSSIRALADKYGVHRRTVRQAIESVGRRRGVRRRGRRRC